MSILVRKYYMYFKYDWESALHFDVKWLVGQGNLQNIKNV